MSNIIQIIVIQLILFAFTGAGYLLGYRHGEKSVQPTLAETTVSQEEEKRLEEQTLQDEAFLQLINYNTDVAYGVKRAGGE